MTLIERTGFEALKRAFGDRRAARVSYLYRDRIRPALESLTYSADARGRRSRRQLEALRDRYKGERCFIIGNGPSLRDTDLARLRDEHTFALNRGYLLFDRIGAPATFLVAVNRYVIEQFGTELLEAGTTTFVSWATRRAVPVPHEPIYVRRSRMFTFSPDVARHGAWEGSTVTYVAMQLAFHMGFSNVVLIGVDHSFATHGPANQLVTSAGADPNHFDPNYFGAGVRWQLPDLEVSEAAYQLARQAYEGDGRSLTDATVGGSLRVFPKVDFDGLFSWPSPVSEGR